MKRPINLLIAWLLCLLALAPWADGLSHATPVRAPSDQSAQPPRYRVQLERVARSVRWPTGIASAGDERLFVLQQRGYIRVLAPGGTFEDEPFLDIRDRVGWEDNWEQGLLGLAFHPDYAANGYFYVTYTTKEGDLRLSRFRADESEHNLTPGGARHHADSDTEVVILEVDEPEGDHNGGDVHFGPDGYLYVGVGDGGAHQAASAQDGGNLRGTILRLDVHSGEPYTVPPDNPFLGDEAVRDEIWLLGLRNPWRFSFDSATGDLFIADVGGERFEEIDYLAADDRAGGYNYGWPCFEGLLELLSGLCEPDAPLTFPIAGYGNDGDCSAVIGGNVYRGSAYPSMAGHYLFADFCRGIIWSLYPTDNGGWQQRIVADTEAWISGFTESADGELYAVDRESAWVYHVTAVDRPHEAYLPFLGWPIVERNEP